MVKIYTNQNITMVGIVKSALENQGIECHLKNENLSGALGELPFLETWPEVWIIDKSKTEAAQEIVKNILEKPQGKKEVWTCISCGEQIEEQFDQCWKCGESKNKKSSQN